MVKLPDIIEIQIGDTVSLISFHKIGLHSRSRDTPYTVSKTNDSRLFIFKRVIK